MLVLNRSPKGAVSLPAKEIEPGKAGNMKSKLAVRILQMLARQPSYPMEIARTLKVHEQKVYYHIRQLEKGGFVQVVKKETMHGAAANVYRITRPAFVVKFRDFDQMQKIPFQARNFLDPFIEDGYLNCSIIVGSPDPHGPEKARSKDGYYGMDLALFLGTYLNNVTKLNVLLDTEAGSEALSDNLILIGGPVVNSIAHQVNDKLPIRFELDNTIRSDISGKLYTSDETGIVVKAANPFNPRKFILVIAGKRNQGTRAVIITFLKHFDQIIEGNIHNRKVIAKVVEGIDLNSDGVVDDVEILE